MIRDCLFYDLFIFDNYKNINNDSPRKFPSEEGETQNNFDLATSYASVRSSEKNSASDQTSLLGLLQTVTEFHRTTSNIDEIDAIKTQSMRYHQSEDQTEITEKG